MLCKQNIVFNFIWWISLLHRDFVCSVCVYIRKMESTHQMINSLPDVNVSCLLKNDIPLGN